MPQNTTITLAVNNWIELTTADVTAITFVNLGPSQILVKGTVGSVKPTNDLAAIPYNPAEGESAVTLASLWPGLTGANRVWAYLPPSVPGTRVMVSHA